MGWGLSLRMFGALCCVALLLAQQQAWEILCVCVCVVSFGGGGGGDGSCEGRVRAALSTWAKSSLCKYPVRKCKNAGVAPTFHTTLQQFSFTMPLWFLPSHRLHVSQTPRSSTAI
ncbi:uncharacterized protein IWZ02DRAFT_440278 [Phyllosticta citriasiana]|uniref:uncharacterized protein n=1 Tax=Phyllosticta citriasiana TaxID=595635 RepID=UPI0030FD7400